MLKTHELCEVCGMPAIVITVTDDDWETPRITNLACSVECLGTWLQIKAGVPVEQILWRKGNG